MPINERVLNIIQGFYDAALDETLWPKALQELTHFTASQAATFWVLDSSEQPRLPTLITYNFDPAFIKAYQEGVVPHDPTVRYLVRHPNQSIVHDGLVITEIEKDRHPYYDWHRNYSDTRFRLVGQVRPAPGAQAGVALHRTRRKGRYEPEDIKRFAVLNGHLEKALAIGFRLGSVTAMQQANTELLDRSPAAVLLLNEHKRVVYANRSAERLCSKGDGIKLCAGEVVTHRKQDHDRLKFLVSQAVSGIVSLGGSPDGLMRVLRPSGKRSYVISVAPISGRYPALTVFRPAVSIVINDPDIPNPLPDQRIQAAYSLTAAEARLASMLASGVELKSAAAELKITYGTARARLAEIFQKTGTRRQGELIKLLLTTLAMT